MKNIFILAMVLSIQAGCSATVKKQFTVIVDPPDAEIRVAPGGGQAERTYRSPAEITVKVPSDPVEASRGRIEIRKEAYAPKTVDLGAVAQQTIRIKLDRLIPYRLKYRLLRPAASDDFSYRDRIVAITMTPRERDFDLKIENLSGKPLKILWDRAEYTDYRNGQHPLMHEGIKPRDRADIVPPQTIPSAGTVQESVFPKSSLFYSPVLREYTKKLLLPVDSDAALSLKGRTLTVFLPVELERAIIPDYTFRFEIVDVIKE